MELFMPYNKFAHRFVMDLALNLCKAVAAVASFISVSKYIKLKVPARSNISGDTSSCCYIITVQSTTNKKSLSSP